MNHRNCCMKCQARSLEPSGFMSTSTSCNFQARNCKIMVYCCKERRRMQEMSIVSWNEALPLTAAVTDLEEAMETPAAASPKEITKREARNMRRRGTSRWQHCCGRESKQRHVLQCCCCCCTQTSTQTQHWTSTFEIKRNLPCDNHTLHSSIDKYIFQNYSNEYGWLTQWAAVIEFLTNLASLTVTPLYPLSPWILSHSWSWKEYFRFINRRAPVQYQWWIFRMLSFLRLQYSSWYRYIIIIRGHRNFHPE